MNRRTTVIGAIALAGGLCLAGIPSANAASGFIAAPNGMVGVTETITINAPSAKGQVVTLGVQVGGTSQTLQTTIGSNGFGYASWTPAAAGTWTFNGLGTIASLGSTSVAVAAMPTFTVLLAQNAVQQGAANNILAAAVAPIGNLAPTGTITLQTSGGAAIASAPLAGDFNGNTSTANISWTPATGGPQSIQAAYTPASGGQLASTSPVSGPNASSAVTTVAMRWPTNLFVGTASVFQAVLGAGMPDGTVAWSFDGKGISGSMPTSNGIASFQWAPPSSGVHTISVAYTGAKPSQTGLVWSNGTSSQTVNIQPARPVDNITVDPPSQPVWNIAQPISMRAGSTVTLVGTSESGTTVLFSEQGPCVIAGAVLTALSAGQCQVTAISPGNAALTPGSETYTITITKAPKKKKG